MTTGVRGCKTSAYAIRSDTRDLVPLVEWSASFNKRDPLPAGFYISFLQTLDEAQRQNADLNRLIMAKWVIDQQEWQWLVQDIEDLAPASSGVSCRRPGNPPSDGLVQPSITSRLA